MWMICLSILLILFQVWWIAEGDRWWSQARARKRKHGSPWSGAPGWVTACMKYRWVHPVKALTPSFYIFYQQVQMFWQHFLCSPLQRIFVAPVLTKSSPILLCSCVCIWVCRNGFLQSPAWLNSSTRHKMTLSYELLVLAWRIYDIQIITFIIYNCMYIFFGLQKPSIRLSLSWQMLVDFFKRAACRDEKSRANTGPIQWKFRRGAGYWSGSNKNCPGNHRFTKLAPRFYWVVLVVGLRAPVLPYMPLKSEGTYQAIYVLACPLNQSRSMWLSSQIEMGLPGLTGHGLYNPFESRFILFILFIV